MFEINKYRDELTDLLNNNAVIDKMYIFGSAFTTKFNDIKSDIDVLVETSDISPEEKGENLISLWDSLEKIFNRKVDLLTNNSLHNPVLKREIELTKKLIYDKQSRKIFI